MLNGTGIVVPAGSPAGRPTSSVVSAETTCS